MSYRIPSWVPRVEFADLPTTQAEDIILRLVPEWAQKFLRKNDGYGKVDNHLGPKGVFPDINRKVGRLERDIWDGRMPPVGSESTRDVIFDLIGHLFLMLHMEDDAPITGMGDLDRTVGTGFTEAGPDYVEPHESGEVTSDDLETVMDALHKVLAGSTITPEQGDAIKRLIAERPDPDDMPNGTSSELGDYHESPLRHHTMEPLPGPLASWKVRPTNPTMEPWADFIMDKEGKVRPLSERAERLIMANKTERPHNDGWEYLPDELQAAIVQIANGFEVVSTPALRRETAQYLSEHGHDGG